jgi:hypothetical protein
MSTSAIVLTSIAGFVIAIVALIAVLAWLKARAARILDDEHARHD